MLEVLETVGSTMDAARESVRSGRLFGPDGGMRYTGVIAREQTAGRGQRGRVWHSAPGESLCATYFFRNRFTAPEHASPISLLAGAAVAETLRKLLPPPVPSPEPSRSAGRIHDVGLKWPNDVLLDGKKVCGILTEMVKAPDGGWAALIGVGVNIGPNSVSPDLADSATSLAQAGIENVTWLQLGELVGEALRNEAANLSDPGFGRILEKWREFDRTAGHRYVFAVENGLSVGTAVGVDDNGALILRTDDGDEVTVTSATSHAAGE